MMGRYRGVTCTRQISQLLKKRTVFTTTTTGGTDARSATYPQLSAQCTALKLMWEDNEPAKQQDFSHRLADKAVQVQKKARNTTDN